LVPSSLVGLALFVVLLAPGLAFALRREHVVPPQEQSAFRESLSVIFVSLVCVTLTGLLAAALRTVWPRNTPNVGALIRTPGTFARAHYVELSWWALGLLAFATLVAMLAADPRIARHLRRAGKSRAARWLTGSTHARISSNTAMYNLVHLHDDAKSGRVRIRITAQMTNGTIVGGYLHSYDTGTDEQDDDIVLSEPQLTTTNGKTRPTRAQYAVISAQNFTRLDVTPVLRRSAALGATIGKTNRPWRGVLPPDP
jgi:Family of unknown function (DUF6338)